MTTETITIYMPLLNEGTDTWRPVTAERLRHNNTFRIVGPQSAEEEWAFAAGTVVAGEPRRFADGTHGIAAAALTERNLAFTERDLILDEVTALQVGLAILKACYGPTFVARFEPYEAVFIDGAWAVMGDSPAHKEARREQERLGPGYFISVRGGGAPCVELSPRDGRVLRVNLAR